MLFISILVIIIVIIIETIYIFLNKEPVSIRENRKDPVDKNSHSFIELTLNDSIEITYKPGYIYTEINDNIFLIYNDNYVLMKKNIIYDIDSKFNIDFIFTDNSIKYFYHQK